MGFSRKHPFTALITLISREKWNALPIWNILADVEKAYTHPLQVFAVAFWMAMMPLAAIFQLITMCCPLFWPYWVWCQIDKAPEKGGRRWTPASNSILWKWFSEYFPITIESEAKLEVDKNYLFIAHPHGILPLGIFGNFCTTATDTALLFPSMKFHLCTLLSNFSTPVLREIIMAVGCIPVSEASIRHVLSHGQGNVVVDVVGGSAESLDQAPGTARLTLYKRSGFLRIALEEGVDLVPVFSFGENNTFFQKDNPRGSMLRLAQEIGKKVLGMSPTLFWGVSIKGPEWGFLPLRSKIVSVVGNPVRVQKCEGEASQEQIDELRTRYIQELQALWDKYKDIHAPNRKEELNIVD